MGNKIAVPDGEYVRILTQSGGDICRFHAGGTIIGAPIISGDRVTVTAQSKAGNKRMGIYTLGGGMISIRNL